MEKDIVFFGVQASGKGTQSDKLLAHFDGGYSYFGPGVYYRILRTAPNEIGDYVTDIMNTGKMVEDPVTNALFDLYFAALQQRNKAMLVDGYARNLAQTQHLMAVAQKYGRKLVGIFLELSDEDAIARMRLRGRADDTPESIATRIEIYHKETIPSVEFFAQQYPMLYVNGNQSIDKVFADILSALGE